MYSPVRIPWQETWAARIEAKAADDGILVFHTADAYESWRTSGRTIIDARPRADFAAGHIPGALSLPAEGLDDEFPAVQVLVSAARPVLVYCAGTSCDESLLVARYMRQQQFTDVAIYPEGLPGWAAGGFRVEAGE
jgi:rhodanese-related sulfurtransferase